jgi:glycosyltransferase involved in cell wall biosynthesis
LQDKILHIITDLSDGGAEAVLYRLCCSTVRTQKHVVVSLVGHGKYGPLLREQGIEVFTLGCRAGISALIKLPGLVRLIQTANPKAVQCWMYHANLMGGIAAKFAGINRIVWGIRHTSLEKDKLATRIVSWLCARLSGGVPTIIVCCSDSSAIIHESYGYEAAKLTVVYNGYDTSCFRTGRSMREKLRLELNLNDQQIVLGMVGRWNPLKDHQNLLRALSVLKKRGHDLACLLIGPQMDRNNHELMRLVYDLDLDRQIKLLGSRTDIPAVMNGLDIHVLSSSGEAFPNVVAEAMACGTPCVVTDVGDAAMIVENPDWVAPPKNPERLAEAIINVLDALEREGRDAVGARCRKRIEENFSLSRMVDAYQELWSLFAKRSNDR